MLQPRIYLLPFVAIGGGALLPLGLAPFDWWPVVLISVIGLQWVVEKSSSVSRAFLYGWLFGVGKYGVGVSWVYVSIREYGGASPELSALLVILFVMGLALFSGLIGLLAYFGRRLSAIGWTFFFAGSFVLCEWILTWFLTGFPWLFVGYAFLDTLYQGIAPIGGILLLSLLGVLTASSLYGIRRDRRLFIFPVGFCILCWMLNGIQWTNPGELKSVALIQGNVSQATKWDPTNAQPILSLYADMMDTVLDVDFVIWPEAAITIPLHRAGPYLEKISSRMEGSLLLGLPILAPLEGQSEKAQKYGHYNGAVVVGDGHGQYVKRKLVPFGEYVPLENSLRGLISFFDLPMSHAIAGSRHQELLVASGMRITTAICYEIVYPQLVAQDSVDGNVIVTISNDSWFGYSIGPHQHLQMARMRALETGRYVLRGTNNGITAIINPAGEIVSSLPQFTRGVLTGSFHAMHGSTIFVQYSNKIVLGLLAISLVFPWLLRRNVRKTSKQ